MKARTIRSVLIALLLVLPALVRADELKLATVFSDHMVLQRDKPVPVWGWADAGEQVTVAFAGQTKTATAGGDGRWSVKLDPMAASAEPRSLVVRSSKQGRRSRADDVLVGEVWLGSGQSNMALTVERALNFESERAAADLPSIRVFTETSTAAKTPQADAHGTWTICSPATVGSYSATLYFLGRDLHRELGVPVGLINSSVGGTPIESWIAAKAQARTPELKDTYTAAATAFAEFDEAAVNAAYEKTLALWKEQVAQAKAAGKRAPAQPRNPADQVKRRGGPGGLFNGKIAPLVPYAIRGVVWYQGEANSAAGKAELYQYQLPLLVSDWRSRWGDELPFAWVQLPNFGRAGDGWSIVREGMLKTRSLPRTGMAITVDIGESDNIHPKNKQEVGRRLALWALGDVYGKQGVATSGPLPAGHKIKGSEVVVSFTHCDAGLHAQGGEVKGFEITGADRKWKPATARIDGDMVIVSNPDVSKPAAVRYAWAADPDCNLFNGAGVPATPFRTDEGP